MRCRMLSFTVVGIVAFGGVASAKTKYTPALPKGSADTFVCRVVNVGSDLLDNVQVQIIGSNGALLKEETLTNPAGWTGSVIYTGTATIGYCKVDGNFSRKRALVTFCVLPSGSLRCDASVGDPGL